jgi:translation initiation factor 1 (eIF-1/SUI1)
VNNIATCTSAKLTRLLAAAAGEYEVNHGLGKLGAKIHDVKLGVKSYGAKVWSHRRYVGAPSRDLDVIYFGAETCNLGANNDDTEFIFRNQSEKSIYVRIIREKGQNVKKTATTVWIVRDLVVGAGLLSTSLQTVCALGQTVLNGTESSSSSHEPRSHPLRERS